MRYINPKNVVTGLVTAVGVLFSFVQPVLAETSPAPDPPWASLPERGQGDVDSAASSVWTMINPVYPGEWLYHKTADGSHPDADEQQLLWLLNRARTNPTAEGVWLADSGDADVARAISSFSVDKETLKAEFAAIPAKPPAAFDRRLYEAAYQHSLDLISRDSQDHEGQFDKVADSGFSYTYLRGNVYSYAKSNIHAHAGFNIDWGDDGGDGTGMQPGRGHRVGKMSIGTSLTNVGIAVVPENDETTNVGPFVVTENYADANTTLADHYDRFVVGTVWEDRNCNEQYDAGEGFSGVTVGSLLATSYHAVSAAGGGYAFPGLEEGDYKLHFSGGELPEPGAVDIHVGTDSVLVDYIYEASVPRPDFSASSRVVCTGSPVLYEDSSYPCSTSRSWSFNGGSPDVADTASVEVSYAAAGSYPVTLSPVNGKGSGGSLTRPGYIEVMDGAVAACAVQSGNLDNKYAMGIYHFQLAGLSMDSGGTVSDGGYVDNSCTGAVRLLADYPYTASITVGPVNAEHVVVSVDGNGDGDFADAGESLFVSPTASMGVQTADLVFDSTLLPTDVLLRLRVKSDFAGTFNNSACTAPTYGQVQDYGVVLTRAQLGDVVRLLQLLSGNSVTTFPYYIPDVDGNGRTDLAECIYLMRAVAGQG